MSVAERLRVPAADVREVHDGEQWCTVDAGELAGIADRASAAGGRLATLFATDDREEGGGFGLHHVWSIDGGFLRVHARIDPAEPRFPSIAARHPSANWLEREVADLFGLAPSGHPNPKRVALHDDWPEGEFPLRRDFADDRRPPRVAGEFHPFRPVTGEGVFQIPVGPVHAGIIEPGHFRFGVAGEPVLYLQLRLFYVHKGIEKRFERLPWRHGLHLAESVSGDTVVGHALAWAHAVERLAGVLVPERARLLRVVLLELERIANHVADIGALATDVAFAVPASRAQMLREGLVGLHGRLFGSRTLRGTIAAGGVKRDLPAKGRQELCEHLDRLEAEFDDLVTLLIDAGTFTDRVDGTGVLPTLVARDLGVVGFAARASGIDLDLRRDHPHDAYGTLRFEVPVEDGGDVRARLMVRAREVEQSLGLLRQALHALGRDEAPAPLAAVPAHLPPLSSALGWTEAWRGACLYWIATDALGRIRRVKVTDPSFHNWPALVEAVPGNIVPDFPVINKSFNLSYSGNDR